MRTQSRYEPFVASGPARVVLEGVPRVGYYDSGDYCPEDVPFASCLRACLEFLGEDYGSRYVLIDKITWRMDNLYTYIMGTSGAAFRLSWGPGWRPDNTLLRYVSLDANEPERRALEATGYGYEFIREEEDRDNEAYFRARIIESIQAGLPVLAYGVVGPPEACIVTGYDEDSDVLTGWSYFQDSPEFNGGVEFEPGGYFRKRDWFAGTEKLIALGENLGRPVPRETYTRALKWALRVVRTPSIGRYPGRSNGLSAYRAWADALLRNEDFSTNDMEALRVQYGAHNDAADVVADGRWYAGEFLKQAAEHVPEMAAKLHEAVACYEAEHDLVWQMWALTGGSGKSDTHMRKFADPSIRAELAELILMAGEKDAEAATHIEAALSAFDKPGRSAFAVSG